MKHPYLAAIIITIVLQELFPFMQWQLLTYVNIYLQAQALVLNATITIML